MRKIAIASQKGGVGKTTIAVNLAVGLANAGEQVLLIDLDPQANATHSLCGPKEIEPSMYDVLAHEVSLRNVILEIRERLHIAPSNIDLAAAELELNGEMAREMRLTRRIEERSAWSYDYLIVDCPPSLGLLTVNALVAVTEVLVPVSPGVFSLSGLLRLEESVTKVRTNLGRPVRIAGIVLNMEDHTRVSADVLTTVLERFGTLVFSTTLPKAVKFEEAHSKSCSIFDHDADSRAARAFERFVKEVRQRGQNGSHRAGR